MKDIKPLISWAKANGEAKIVDRILVKLLPELIKNQYELTSEMIDNQQELAVPIDLYNKIKRVAEDLTGLQYN